ncbi:hypothetical protein C8F04DRAFT_1330302 [Mycena alexandri]|uniref:Uncharacterized protein n=1 Tax=Mycena alexandri TaxID=1745969 RepID=A0AAD6S0H7_9AGAR|nr:hypothetical protein C8F04DRAFT_1330302 [Mycena alexandri]
MHSLPFRSLIRLFTGDSASPTLWNIYFADFRLPPHRDDILLNGRPVSQAEQADDNLIMSTLFPTFQAKVTHFFVWGTNKCTFVSAKKSKRMIFGPLPSVIPVLRLGDLIVELVWEFKYVGIWITSIHTNIFARHYSIKASKARGTSSAAFALKHRIGTLPVKEGLQIYMARVDCYLISGCELSLDTDGSLLKEHLDVQHTFLRRLLGLNSHSLLAVLFTKTGQMPIRIHRLLIALGRLKYMVALEQEQGRVVRDVFLDSINLLREGKPGWASDLVIMLSRLPTPIEVGPDDLLSIDFVNALETRIVQIVNTDLQNDIDRLVKTHLLRNRLEMGDDRALVLAPRRLRHYLTVVAVPAHRKALTGLLLSDHLLSVERLRYTTRYRDPVPRNFRLCRLCRGSVEDEVHALFDCTAELRLMQLRARFLASLSVCDPKVHALYVQITNYDFLLQLVSTRKGVKVFAKYVYNVLALFQEFPQYFPVVFRRNT